MVLYGFGCSARTPTGLPRPRVTSTFLVALEPQRDLLDLVALKQDLEELLGRRVDVAEEEGLSPYLREKILHEVRPI